MDATTSRIARCLLPSPPLVAPRVRDAPRRAAQGEDPPAGVRPIDRLVPHRRAARGTVVGRERPERGGVPAHLVTAPSVGLIARADRIEPHPRRIVVPTSGRDRPHGRRGGARIDLAKNAATEVRRPSVRLDVTNVTRTVSVVSIVVDPLVRDAHRRVPSYVVNAWRRAEVSHPLTVNHDPGFADRRVALAPTHVVPVPTHVVLVSRNVNEPNAPRVAPSRRVRVVIQAHALVGHLVN